jgi:hypothetical protein
MYFTWKRTRMPDSFIGYPLLDTCSIAAKRQQARNREPRSHVSLHASILTCLHACPSLSNLEPSSDGRGQGGMRAGEAYR